VSPRVARLQELDLNWNGIGDEGALARAASTFLSLHAEDRFMAGLRLHHNSVGAAGREALRARFGSSLSL
jgi:hypothetical protein